MLLVQCAAAQARQLSSAADLLRQHGFSSTTKALSSQYAQRAWSAINLIGLVDNLCANLCMTPGQQLTT
jgi:hypothetical protein